MVPSTPYGNGCLSNANSVRQTWTRQMEMHNPALLMSFLIQPFARITHWPAFLLQIQRNFKLFVPNGVHKTPAQRHGDTWTCEKLRLLKACRFYVFLWEYQTLHCYWKEGWQNHVGSPASSSVVTHETRWNFAAGCPKLYGSHPTSCSCQEQVNIEYQERF